MFVNNDKENGLHKYKWVAIVTSLIVVGIGIIAQDWLIILVGLVGVGVSQFTDVFEAA